MLYQLQQSLLLHWLPEILGLKYTVLLYSAALYGTVHKNTTPRNWPDRTRRREKYGRDHRRADGESCNRSFDNLVHARIILKISHNVKREYTRQAQMWYNMPI